MNRKNIAYQLSVSALNGAWTESSIARHFKQTYQDENLDSEAIAREVFTKTQKYSEKNPSHISSIIIKNKKFNEWVLKLKTPPQVKTIPFSTPIMEKQPEFITKPLPKIESVKDLSLWLGLSIKDLEWFADIQNRQSRMKNPKLHHYSYQWIKKSNGKHRLLEIPKSGLKSIQRKILHDILDLIPPHKTAHGFHKNTSCKTHASLHTNKAIVIKFDLADFFHSVPKGRIIGLFDYLGYPKDVTQYLAALCVHMPSPYLTGSSFQKLSFEKQKILLSQHLPQGAPTSPSLANLCTWKTDMRLESFAKKMGMTYSRYADDIAFSGDKNLKNKFPYIRKIIGQIAAEEGFNINHSKTKLMTQAQCQSLVGITLNSHPNIKRSEYDRLKAILHNCVKYGATSQNKNNHENFKLHLHGKISYIQNINSEKGRKLLSTYKKIDWND